ncbi:hypothetical protein BH11PLA1_BH11PLA1_14090 [soil metagenome]
MPTTKTSSNKNFKKTTLKKTTFKNANFKAAAKPASRSARTAPKAGAKFNTFSNKTGKNFNANAGTFNATTGKFTKVAKNAKTAKKTFAKSAQPTPKSFGKNFPKTFNGYPTNFNQFSADNWVNFAAAIANFRPSRTSGTKFNTTTKSTTAKSFKNTSPNGSFVAKTRNTKPTAFNKNAQRPTAKNGNTFGFSTFTSTGRKQNVGNTFSGKNTNSAFKAGYKTNFKSNRKAA